jgi:hypothetical protein
LDEAKSTLLEQNESSPFDEATSKPTKVVKNTKHESKVVKKESPKSTSSHKKERGAKHKNPYLDDDDQYVDDKEMTGSRKLVEVYQENFDDNLTDDDADHKSLEKAGNCTVIQKANAALMAKYGKGHLEHVYSKENVMTVFQPLLLISLFSPLTHI